MAAAPGVAHAHGTDGGAAPASAPAGGAEAKLRAFETEAIGAEHAAAHARQRALAREAPRGRSATQVQAQAAPPPAVPVNVGGKWGDARPIPVIAITSVMLPTGKVLMFAYPARPDYGPSDYANAFVWDPVSGASKQVNPPIDPATGKPTNIWCGGASLLSDGRVLITGGNVNDPRTDFHGINKVFTFNPFTEKWDLPTKNTPMAQGRWYPSQVLMPDGRTLVAGGLARPGDADFGVGNNTNNDLELISPNGTIERKQSFFNGGGGEPPLSGLYPRMFWMPSGRALSVGPFATDTWFLNPGPPGAPTTWTDAANLSAARDWGTAVLLSGGRVLTLGGSALAAVPPEGELPTGDRPARSTTELFDEDTPASGWQARDAMEVGRSHANSVLLPDGKVATVGGGYGEDSSEEFYRWLFSEEQKRAELFNPATNTTVLGNAQAEARTYHSTAVLLPDARVMSAGDDINGPGGPPTGTNSDTAEIYSPPYLFQADGSLAPRPVIDQAPQSLPMGAEFEIAASGATADKAVLVAPGAATHATDMSQRLVPLADPEPRPGGRLALTLPTDKNVAPPGYYMLFTLSAAGVPSVAKFVCIGATGTGEIGPCVAPPSPPDPPPPTPPKVDVKPSLSVSGALPRMRTLKRKQRFTITVQLSEPGKVTVSALLERGRRPAKSIAKQRAVTFKTAGKRRVTFKLTRAGRRLLVGKRRGVVRIRAKAFLTSKRSLPLVQVRRKLR